MFGRRSRRANWPLIALVLCGATAAGLYVAGAAWVQAQQGDYAFAELLLPRFLDVLVVAWLFWIGSAIGSFLNVVAWRVPRGRSINGLSHCPWCNTRLSARDNWPVFGWVALRGRCRTCRLPISPRYPIVELCVGLTVTLLGVAELYSGGGNLPFVAERSHPRGPMSTPPVTWELLVVAIYHTVAVSGSWALALVRFDGHRLPRGLVFCVFLLVLGPLWVWPPLMVVPWQATVPAGWQPTSHWDALLRLITALVAATVTARALARYVCPTADPKLDPTGSGTGRLIDLTALLCVPAVVVGWQAVLGVVLLAVLLAGTLARLAQTAFSAQEGSAQKGSVPPFDSLRWLGVSLPVALAVQIAFWHSLEDFRYWPGASSPPWVILLAAGLILIVPVWLRLRPAHRDTDPRSAIRSEEPD